MTLYSGRATDQTELDGNPRNFYYIIVQCTNGTNARFDSPFDNMNSSSNSSVRCELHWDVSNNCTISCSTYFTKVTGYMS